jgi:hypothetical protein
VILISCSIASADVSTANSDYQTGLVGAAAVVQALLARTKEDKTFDIDVSLTQYNIWFYRLGLQSEAVQQSLREMHKGLELRHDQDVLEGVVRTHTSVLKARPDLVQPEYFWRWTGVSGILIPRSRSSRRLSS